MFDICYKIIFFFFFFFFSGYQNYQIGKVMISTIECSMTSVMLEMFSESNNITKIVSINHYQ